MKFNEKTIKQLIKAESAPLVNIPMEAMMIIHDSTLPGELRAFLEQLVAYGTAVFLTTSDCEVVGNKATVKGNYKRHDLMKFLGDNTQRIIKILKEASEHYEDNQSN